MNKIFLILQREYLIRIRKRTFLLMTFLTPILFAALFIVPVLLSKGFEGVKTVEVFDENEKFTEKIKGDDKLKFVKSKNATLQKAKDNLVKNKFYAVLYIPKIDIEQPKGIQLFAEKSVSLEVDRKITRALEAAIEDMKLLNSGISKEMIEKMKTKVNIETKKISGEDSSSAVAFIIGMAAAFMIYLSVLLYGAQVMRSVVEEKSNRIIEVLISSVKPFELMMGKILGVALIGLTQFALWIVLTFAITAGASYFMNLEDVQKQQMEQSVGDNPEAKKMIEEQQKNMGSQILGSLATMNIPLLIGTFLFYFIGGYFLYSAMFAAVASAVDNETDSQQFTAPITIPFILSFLMAQMVIQDPDGQVAFWMSMIPFTSPIIMMIRVPFDVPVWQLVLSMTILAATFVGITYLAARIYRVGILMYGKKVTFKELGKWLFYKV